MFITQTSTLAILVLLVFLLSTVMIVGGMILDKLDKLSDQGRDSSNVE